MAKLKCPKCHNYMFPDYELDRSYCLHCGYGKPTDEEIRNAKWPNV